MVINGDCMEVLKTLESNSIDSLVTDPPAGISFMGKNWDSDKGGRDAWIKWMSEIMAECLRVMKPGAHGLVWSLPRTSHWTAMSLEDAGFEVRDCVSHLFGSGFPKSLNVSKALNKAGKEFKQWDGFGTALKPAVEMWWLVRKPLSEKTVAANVLKWGTGGINIDGCRIEAKDQSILEKNLDRVQSQSQSKIATALTPKEQIRLNSYTPQGRFPTNLVLSHSPYCTDTQCDIECAIAMLDEQTKDTRAGKPSGSARCPVKRSCVPGLDQSNRELKNIQTYETGQVSGASRFFYCSKVSPSERNAGIEGVKNTHPTLKSQKLMRYFCKLITPPNGIILDPFMGSGSTGLAAKSEGFEFIGIEKEKEYFEIAQKRIG